MQHKIDRMRTRVCSSTYESEELPHQLFQRILIRILVLIKI